MAQIGEQRKLEHKWRFTVEIDGFASAHFNKCSALEFEIAKVEHWEGGNIIPHKEPGRVTVSDLTLDRGVGLDRDVYNWAKEAADFVRNGGGLPEELKRNVEIVQRDRAGNEVRRWAVYNAWPQKFQAGEWDNNSDEVVIEQLVLCIDYFEEADPN